MGKGAHGWRSLDLDRRFTRSLRRGCADRTGHVPRYETTVMKVRELDETLSLITKVFSNPSVEPGQRDQLRRAKRELERIAQSGKLKEERVFRAVEIVANVLLEIVRHNADRRPS